MNFTRFGYLSDMAEDEPIWWECPDGDAWQVVVDRVTGIAFSAWIGEGARRSGVSRIPRFDAAMFFEELGL